MRGGWGLMLVLLGCGGGSPTPANDVPAPPLDSRPSEPLDDGAVVLPSFEAVLVPVALAPPVHVCPDCPFADDSNDGSESLPVRSLARALELGTDLRLASRYALDAPTGYQAGLTLPKGARLDGRWVVSGPPGELSWMRAGERAQVRGGLVASGGGVRLSGLEVYGRITALNADAVIEDVDVIDATPVAIDVSGGSVRLASVRVSTGAPVGLFISHARAELRAVFVEGATVGVQLESLVALQWTGGSSHAYLGDVCAGVRWTGGADEPSSISEVEVSGCAVVDGASAPRWNTGFHVEACSPQSAGIRLSNVRAQGGWMGGAHDAVSTTVGVFVKDGCRVRLESSSVLGASQMPQDVSARSGRIAAGVWCEGAPCVVTRNRSIIGAQTVKPLMATAIHCLNGCDEVTDNRGVWAGPHGGFALNADGASPSVLRNGLLSEVTTNGSGLIADNLVSGGLTLAVGAPVVVFNTVLGSVVSNGPGRFLNNVFHAPWAGVAFESTAVAPAELSNNDFWAPGGGVLYRRTGADLRDPAVFGMGSLSVDPLFAADPPHLLPSSPLRGAGCAMPAAGVDFDGDARPMSAPDVGADQTP